MKRIIVSTSFSRMTRFSICLVFLGSLVSSCKPNEASPAAPLQPPPIIAIATSTEAPLPTRTLQPTPTLMPVATEEPAGGGVSLSLFPVNPNAKQVTYKPEKPAQPLPEDVLREIDFSGGAGGGVYEAPSCLDLPHPMSGPTTLYATEVAEWGDRIEVGVCGWKPGDEILYQFVAPDGTILKDQTWTIKETDSLIWADYRFELNAVVGTYTHRFIGHEKTFDQPVLLQLPTGPRLYALSTFPIRFQLYNFQPNEVVRFFLYTYYSGHPGYINSQQVAPLFGWQEFTVDDQGQLIVEVDGNFDGVFVAVGNISGEAPRPFPNFSDGKAISVMASFPVQVFVPTKDEYAQTPAIWDEVDYVDLDEPGEQVYHHTIQANSSYIWRFTWCAEDDTTLRKNRDSMELVFSINDVVLYDHLLEWFTKESTAGGKCTRWVTLLKGWESGLEYDLTIEYQFKDAVNDGSDTYPAGKYIQKIILKVE